MWAQPAMPRRYERGEGMEVTMARWGPWFPLKPHAFLHDLQDFTISMPLFCSCNVGIITLPLLSLLPPLFFGTERIQEGLISVGIYQCYWHVNNTSRDVSSLLRADKAPRGAAAPDVSAQAVFPFNPKSEALSGDKTESMHNSFWLSGF